MPFIYKPKTNKNNYKKDNSQVKLRQKLYQIPEYRKKRDWYMMQNPICEDCLKEEIENEDGTYTSKVTPSEHLHHKKSPFAKGLLSDERMERLMDDNNWMALCAFHHQYEHKLIEENKKKNKQLYNTKI